MIKKHKFYFFFWKLYLNLRGIRVGSFCTIVSTEKNRLIMGIIPLLSGDSITNNTFGFNININWFEPLHGSDPRYHSYSSYSYKNFQKEIEISY